jgi:hypothetical protein
MNLNKVDIALKRAIYDTIVDMISKNITPNVEYERHDNPFDEIIMVDYTECAISVNSFSDELDTIMVCPVFFDSALPGIPAIGAATHKIKLADPDCFDKMLEAVQEYVKG